MEDQASDSNGNDDDLPDAGIPMDRRTRLRELQDQAYYAVLRAFKAESRALSPEKARLISVLMRVLDISFKQHKYYLNTINNDNDILEIRGDIEHKEEHQAQTSETTSKPVLHVPCKKQKTSQLNEECTPSDPIGNRSFSASPLSLRSWGKNSPESLVGRMAHIRMPGDDEFNEFVIKQYNPEEGLHFLDSEKETMYDPCSWVDLKEIPPEDILWEGEDPGIKACSLAPGQSWLRPTSTIGRKRGSTDSQFKEPPLPSKDIITGEKPLKEMEKVTSATPPDPSDLEKAKKSDQKRVQVDATERIGDLSLDEQVEPESEQPKSNQPDKKEKKQGDDEKTTVTNSEESGDEMTIG